MRVRLAAFEGEPAQTAERRTEMPTTGRVSPKRYGCSHCGAVSSEITNHWGEIYSPCSRCSWRRPLSGTVKVCLEPMPAGYAEPEPWRGDVCEITVVSP